jgi:hypothetical protein
MMGFFFLYNSYQRLHFDVYISVVQFYGNFVTVLRHCVVVICSKMKFFGITVTLLSVDRKVIKGKLLNR